MSKRDDDWEIIDPIKFTIGFFKVLFAIIKALFGLAEKLYNALTSSERSVRVGAVIFVLFIIFVVLSIGFFICIQNL
jgi:uncharacterized membrane protein